jgi:hypothetical protein
MTDLSISNVVNISVSAANMGVNAYNTSNLAIISNEPVAQAVQTISFSGVAASGAFVLKFGLLSTVSIPFSATAATIQTDINALAGLGNVVVSGSIASQTLTLTQPGLLGAIPLPTIPTNTLDTAGSVAIVITPTNVSSGWSGGTLGYSLYSAPSQVGIDFGTSSVTYEMANAVFGQQPNILAGNGQLIVIPQVVEQQTLTLSGIPASGNFVLEYNGNSTTSLAYNATPAQIQAALQLLPSLSQVQVTGSLAGELLTVYFNGVYGPALPILIPTNTLATVAPAAITITDATTVIGESYGAAIARTQGLVQYFGVMPTQTLAVIGQADMLSAAATVLPLNLISFQVSYNQADISPGGMIDLLRSGSFNNTRGLYYGDSSSSGLNAILMMAAYAGRALSVNFSGSNTTETMNLKVLADIQPDPTMNQTIYGLAESSGADLYVSYQGASSVVSNGANKFFDQVYNLEWFVGALQVSGFNYLAQSNTKVPQTEEGMDGLKGAYQNVCAQAITNQYGAPGTWTSPTTFGNQGLFLQNISQYGFYVYSQPISSQLATARAARQAPLVQVALKEAGAIESSTVIVFVNN